MKSKYIEQLFNELKDRVEYDSDIKALYLIINKMLDIDENRAIEWWVYLLNNYDFKSLKNDIDFRGILYDIPKEMFKRGLGDNFWRIRGSIKEDKKKIIDNSVLNVYKDSAIKDVLEYMVMEKKFLEEKKLVNNILDNRADIAKEVFELGDFVRFIIMLHLKYDNIDKDWLFHLIYLLDDNKERAKLSTLLIDYI